MRERKDELEARLQKFDQSRSKLSSDNELGKLVFNSYHYLTPFNYFILDFKYSLLRGYTPSRILKIYFIALAPVEGQDAERLFPKQLA